MDTILYTQEQFNQDIVTLVKKIDQRRFNLIVGINRGGCLPAVCLSHSLHVPATMIDYSTRDGANIHPQSLDAYFEEIGVTHKSILLVDDLIDSGKSMTQLIRIASNHCDVSVATLLHNTDITLSVDHYWGTAYSRTDEPRYFDFWWEMYRV